MSRKKQRKSKKIFLNFQKIKKPFFYLSVFLIFIVLIFNIVASQKISPLYLGLINYDRNAYIDFLKKIKNFSFFEEQLENAKNLFGENIVDEVFQKEKKRDIKIAKLEEALKKNPKARDVLYSLYLLYDDLGDKIKAQEYLKKARQIDPNIENFTK